MFAEHHLLDAMTGCMATVMAGKRRVGRHSLERVDERSWSVDGREFSIDHVRSIHAEDGQYTVTLWSSWRGDQA